MHVAGLLLTVLRCSFRLGRQEDAHEYLVALLDAMHESLLEGFKPKPAPSVAETSMIFRIFAGKIRSQVCLLLPCLDRTILSQAFASNPLPSLNQGKEGCWV